MKFITIFYLLCVLIYWPVEILNAQDNTGADLGRAIKIGDAFDGPKKVHLMRGKVRSVDWENLEMKVVVLDFFDTYCGTCIQAMPHLQQLQDRFEDKLQVFSVTWQDKATLDKFFENNLYLKENKVNLPVIYADKDLKRLFPYQAAPHVVFLYKGKVKAITFNRLVTAENIEKLYRDEQIELPLKDDFGKIDMEAQLGSNIKAGIWISGYQDGVPGRQLSFESDSASQNFRSSILNRSVYRSLLNTWTYIKKPTFLVTPDRIVWNVKDSSVYDDLKHKGEEWLSRYAICYERRDIMSRPDSVQAKIVLEDLHSLLGLRSYWGTKKMKSLIIRHCPLRKDTGRLAPNLKNYRGTAVLAGMLGLSGKYPPVSDQVNSDQVLSIGDFSTLEELNQQLRTYGVEITEGNADIDVFVIEEER